jgi:hypothetical protein
MLLLKCSGEPTSRPGTFLFGLLLQTQTRASLNDRLLRAVSKGSQLSNRTGRQTQSRACLAWLLNRPATDPDAAYPGSASPFAQQGKRIPKRARPQPRQASLWAAWEHTNTIVPSTGDPQAWDRYAYVDNNPVAFVDPSGHIACYDARDENCGQSHEYRNLLRSLPNAPIVRNGNKAQEYHDKTIQNYYDIRMQLYLETGDTYISPDGKIKDPAVVAMIIAGEFQTAGKGKENGYAFEEAKEALSNQYNGTFGVFNQTPCGGACSFPEQLMWLQTMEGFYNKDTSDLESHFEASLGDAVQAMNGYANGTNESWVWGNIHNEAWFKNHQYVTRYKDFVVLTSQQNRARP